MKSCGQILMFKNLKKYFFENSICTWPHSQGQTLKYAGLDLEEKECFAHGQLYVAMSRVGDGKKLFVYSKDRKSRNVVHKAALR